MRISKLMGLAVTIVAMAVVINTLALSSADVRNPVTLSVVTTGTALLAITAPGTPDGDLTISSASGKYSIQVEDGVQPDSTYVFGDTIVITNNSDEDLDITYSFATLPVGMTMTLKNTAGGADLNPGINLLPGGTVTAYLTITTGTSVATQAVNPTLTITGTKTP